MHMADECVSLQALQWPESLCTVLPVSKRSSFPADSNLPSLVKQLGPWLTLSLGQMSPFLGPCTH